MVAHCLGRLECSMAIPQHKRDAALLHGALVALGFLAVIDNVVADVKIELEFGY